MEIPYGMKRIALFIMLLVSLAAQAQTELYNRYARQTGVKVASVSGFAIDSVSQVDVTVIEAVDDEGWAWMKGEFYIGDLAAEQEQGLRDGSDVVLFARRSRANPKENAPVVGEDIDVAASCYMGVSYLQRTVYIFCADSEAQSDAIATLLVKKIMHSSR